MFIDGGLLTACVQVNEHPVIDISEDVRVADPEAIDPVIPKVQLNEVEIPPSAM